MVRTKIIATLGPASSTPAVLRRMITKGLDMVRLNFSHGCHRDHREKINLVRALNKKMRRGIKIIQDLEGYRLRIGRLPQPLALKKRSSFYLTQRDIIGDAGEVPFDYCGNLKENYEARNKDYAGVYKG